MFKKSSLVVAVVAILVVISSTVLAATFIVTPSNNQGWSISNFGTTVPFAFTETDSTTGSGSLEIGPIPVGGKFIAAYPGDGSQLGAQANSFTMAYDLQLLADGAGMNGTAELYVIIYVDIFANGVETFYDCRYDYVPGFGTTIGTWFNFSITPSTTPTNVGVRNASICPATLGGLDPADTVNYITINGGDNSDNDVGLQARFDNAVINGDVFDFEATLPVVEVTDEETGETITVVVPTFYDGRINNFDDAAPVSMYPVSYGANGMGIHIYDINASSEGTLSMLITPEQIAAVPVNPEVNTVIAEVATNFNYVIVSRLPNGNFQVNVNQPNGKTYIIIFPVIAEGGGGYVSYETP